MGSVYRHEPKELEQAYSNSPQMYGINETLLARLYKITGENFNDSYMNLLPQDNFCMKKWNSEQFPLESI